MSIPVYRGGSEAHRDWEGRQRTVLPSGLPCTTFCPPHSLWLWCAALVMFSQAGEPDGSSRCTRFRGGEEQMGGEKKEEAEGRTWCGIGIACGMQ